MVKHVETWFELKKSKWVFKVGVFIWIDICSKIQMSLDD